MFESPYATTPKRLSSHGLLALLGATSLLVTLPAATQRLAPTKAKSAKENRIEGPAPANFMHSVKGLKHRIEALKKAAHTRRGDKDADDRDKDRHEEKRGGKEAEEEDGTDFLEAYLYRYQQRAYPFDTIDYAAYAKALEHRDQMPAADWGGNGLVKPNIIGGSWQFVGPNKLPVPYRTYYGNSVLNGRVNAVAFDPFVPTTYYMGTAGGGFFRSTDSGTTWTALSDTWPVLLTSSIAIDPTNNNVIYVGTGDFDGSGNFATGIMKSVDGGANWQNIGKSQFGTCAIKGLVIDPENPGTLIVAPGRGPGSTSKLWRSTNGGSTFTAVINTAYTWSGLAWGANDGNGNRHLYACGHSGAGVWKSDNRGVTWTKLTVPSSTSSDSIQIATSPTFPNNVYLLDGYNAAIYRSTNAGVTWTDVTGNFPTDSGYAWSQYNYDIHIECGTRISGATTYDVIYVGNIDLVQSIDGGATWRSIGGPTYGSGSILHNDQHALAVDPANPTQALVGNDGGAYLLTNSATYATFSYRSLNNVGNATQFYKIAVHPTDPTRIIGGTQDNATPVPTGSLAVWKNVAGGDGAFCAIRDSNIQFGSIYNLDVVRTSNGWANESDISPSIGSDPVAFFAPITLDTPGTYLYAGTNYLYRYTVASNAWTNQIGGTQLSSSGVIEAIAVAPTNNNRLYTGASNGEVWTSPDGGATWTKISTGSPALPNRSITSIAALPNAPTTALVGLSGTGTGHLYRCLDVTAATRVWTSVSGSGVTALPNVSLNGIALDVDNPATTWYVATDVGVFMTTDSGAHWANATAPLGLPNAEVDDLKMQNATRTLYVGTFGRGIWKIGLPNSAYNVSGTIALDGIPNIGAVNSGAPIGPITFIFRPTGGSANFTRLATLTASGGFALPNVPAGQYNLAIKGSKWLQVVVPVDASAGDVTGLNLTLEPGDANNDNMVDLSDFGLFVNAFGSLYDPAHPGDYDARPDFNCDGSVDITDFGLMVNNYGTVGAP